MNEEDKNAVEWLKNDLKETIEMGKKWGFQEEIKNKKELINLIERQQDMIKNALYIINKNEKEKIDQTWLYNFDKCATLKGDNK